MKMVSCLSLMVVLMGLMKGATAGEYLVGGSLGWTLPPNTSFYSEWAADKTFLVGDVLAFNWSGEHTLVDSTKEEYDNCSNPTGIWIGSSVRITLDTTGPRYFYCSVDNHCVQGQKMAITVSEPSTTSSPSPPPPPSGAHATGATSLLLGLISSALVISFLTFMR